jgi:hypothetical protein
VKWSLRECLDSITCRSSRSPDFPLHLPSTLLVIPNRLDECGNLAEHGQHGNPMVIQALSRAEKATKSHIQELAGAIFTVRTTKYRALPRLRPLLTSYPEQGI